jgi:bifunctional DNA-binding transcriptional regulator/antitoxin component of YhaV-PrlF toxin-antitoxin module
MEKIIKFDNQGRLYIPEEMRKILRFKSLVAKLTEGKIVLEPIEENPIEALGKIGKDKLKEKSIKQLKKQARKDIENEAGKKVRR